MHTALWPATLGYFLDQRLFGLLNFDELERVRRHFVDFVRATGPLPTLRIGRQPYGVLPVTALDRWQPLEAGDAGARVTSALRSLRAAFRRAIAGVPRVRETSDPLQADRDLMAVLRMLPASNGFSLRHVFGSNFVENFWTFFNVDLDHTWWAHQQQATQPTVAISGMPATTPQGTSLFAPWVDGFSGPLVAATGYITALAGASLGALRGGVLPDTAPRPLLYSLLRHALLATYSFAAGRLLQRTNAITPAQRQDPELIDIELRADADTRPPPRTAEQHRTRRPDHWRLSGQRRQRGAA